jgi:hypothetical protein
VHFENIWLAEIPRRINVIKYSFYTIPIYSSECESGVSHMNLIQTPLRSSLLIYTVSALFHMNCWPSSHPEKPNKLCPIMAALRATFCNSDTKQKNEVETMTPLKTRCRFGTSYNYNLLPWVSFVYFVVRYQSVF